VANPRRQLVVAGEVAEPAPTFTATRADLAVPTQRPTMASALSFVYREDTKWTKHTEIMFYFVSFVMFVTS
jgi:hypothetical protein